MSKKTTIRYTITEDCQKNLIEQGENGERTRTVDVDLSSDLDSNAVGIDTDGTPYVNGIYRKNEIDATQNHVLAPHEAAQTILEEVEKRIAEKQRKTEEKNLSSLAVL